MEKGRTLPRKKPEPIVVEPDDELVENQRDMFVSPFMGVRDIFSDRFFGRLMGDVTDFQSQFKNLEEELSRRDNKGYCEVKSYSSYVEYKDGKVVKKDEKGYHYKNDNGKGFMKVLKGGPEEREENEGKFDFGGDRLRIK